MRRLFVLCLWAAICIALSKTPVEAGGDPKPLQLKYEPWMKSCLGKSDCFVGAGARGACIPSGGGVVIAVHHDKPPTLSVQLETDRGHEGGISLQIDQDDPILIFHPQCFAFACRGSLEIDSALIERLRSAHTIAVDARTADRRRINFSFSLTGFAEALDGPGTEPKVIEYDATSDEWKKMIKKAETNKRPQCEQ